VDEPHERIAGDDALEQQRAGALLEHARDAARERAEHLPGAPPVAGAFRHFEHHGLGAAVA
jgi:hypothetical protein